MKKLISNMAALAASRKELLTEAGKYFIVGGVCTVLDFALLFVLKEYFRVPVLTASVISFMSGTILNYYLCTLWIFKIRTVENRNLEIFYYAIITGVGLGINFFVIWMVTYSFGLHFMLAKLMATFCTYWWNFGARKYFLHSKTGLRPEPAAAAE